MDNLKLDNFLLAQFTALREEILAIKASLIKLQLIGITGIPLIMGIGGKYDSPVILLFIPFISLVFIFIFIFEQSCIMRIGDYIKEHIEKRMCLECEAFTGWEQWLQDNPNGMKKRRFLYPELLLYSAIHIVFVIYYIIGVYFAYDKIYLSESESWKKLYPFVLYFYVVLFLAALPLTLTYFPKFHSERRRAPS